MIKLYISASLDIQKEKKRCGQCYFSQQDILTKKFNADYYSLFIENLVKKQYIPAFQMFVVLRNQNMKENLGCFD